MKDQLRKAIEEHRFPDSMIWRAWMDRVIDGDTYVCRFDVGFNIFPKFDVRLKGYDSPEIVGVNRAAGLAAREYVRKIIPVGSPLIVTTYRWRRSWNRYLGEVQFPLDDEWADLGTRLFDTGHAVVWP